MVDWMPIVIQERQHRQLVGVSQKMIDDEDGKGQKIIKKN
jgi:hypothetical protein